jgi:hypothetical protein
MAKFRKSRIVFKPDPVCGERYRVGTANCVISGNGLWFLGEKGTKFSCTIFLAFTDPDEDQASLRVFAVPRRYPNKTGLIYTDPGFLRGVKALLKEVGMPAWSQVDYSEQGMQGFNYVDMEVCSKRAFKWLREQTE